MDTADLQRLLNANGFPCGTADGVVGPKTRAAVTRFQTAWNGESWLQPNLAADGVPGPLTLAAAEHLPHLSEHFTTDELRSHVKDGACYVNRRLLVALETLRARLGGQALRVIDAYRDPAHNAKVGGASNSMHLFGLAADLEPTASVAAIAGLGLFSGIGDRHGLVVHVDLRHLSAHNATPKATPGHPARWAY